jgi:uncharacterized membrane protein
MTTEAEPKGCGSRYRFWIIPVAFLATLFALAMGALLLEWAGVISLPILRGLSPPFWFVFPLGFVLVWLVVIFLVRPWRPRSGWGWGREWSSPLDRGEVVRVRFARGEISKEQMLGLLRDLGETTPSMRREQSP